MFGFHIHHEILIFLSNRILNSVSLAYSSCQQTHYFNYSKQLPSTAIIIQQHTLIEIMLGRGWKEEDFKIFASDPLQETVKPPCYHRMVCTMLSITENLQANQQYKNHTRLVKTCNARS